MARTCLSQQSERMLAWFFAQGVSAIDFHLRCPKNPKAQYGCPDDWVWLTHHERLSHDKALQLLRWCRYKNINGSDIYIRPHRHDDQPIVFLDDLSIRKAWTVAKAYRSLIVQTSRNNTQVWLSINKALNEQDRKALQQYIAYRGYTDPGSVSGEHLGRICGFKSQKRDGWVTLLGDSPMARYSPPDLTPPSSPHRGACVKGSYHGESQSERDFSWVLSRLRHGYPAEKIMDLLEVSAKNRGKACPSKYAKRTVENAMTILT